MEDTQLGAGDWASIITAVVTSVGILLAYLELHRSTRIQRGQFLLGATERYFAESEARRLFYDIDYGRFQINFIEGDPATVERGAGQEAKPFMRSEEERALDNLLYTFDVIGRLVDLGSLDVREAELFAFQAKRVLENEYVLKYVEWINRDRARFGVKAPAHQAAFKLVARLSEAKRGESTAHNRTPAADR